MAEENKKVETKTYTGSCHCGAVQFSTEADFSEGVGLCNCSICYKLNLVVRLCPSSSLNITAGKDNLQDYQFGSKKYHHLFCKTCGVHPFVQGNDPAMGGDTLFVNVNCLDNLILDNMKINHFDGKAGTWAIYKTGTL